MKDKICHCEMSIIVNEMAIDGVMGCLTDEEINNPGTWKFLEQGRKELTGEKVCDLTKVDYCTKSGFDVDSPEFAEFFGHMRT